MKTNISYRVPEGYFDRLEKSLTQIPGKYPLPEDSGGFIRLRPYLALAASFLIILAGGTAVLKMSVKDAMPTSLSSFERIQLADLLPVTSQDVLYGFDSQVEPETITDKDITEYLIESGTTIEQLECYYEENR